MTFLSKRVEGKNAKQAIYGGASLFGHLIKTSGHGPALIVPACIVGWTTRLREVPSNLSHAVILQKKCWRIWDERKQCQVFIPVRHPAELRPLVHLLYG